MGRREKPYRLYQKTKYRYWRAPKSSGWKSTGETDRQEAEKYVLKQTANAAKVGVLKELPPKIRAEVAMELLKPTERVTLKEFLAPYFVWETCLREGVFREELSRDPCLGIGKINVPRREAGTFHVEELQKLFPEEGLGPWLDRQDYNCFLVAAATGLRSSEILALQWRHIDVDNNLARVEQAWKFKMHELGLPKWGRTRTTPLPAKTANALKELRAESLHVLPDALVFCYPDGTRLGDRWWNEHFHKATTAAKIDAKARNLKPHSFRHTLVTLLADKGQQPEKIRAALGWTNASTQDGYTHWEQTDLNGQATIVDSLFENA